MNERDFRVKVRELLTFVYDESSPKLNHVMNSGCGLKEDVENEPDDSYLVAKAFVVQFLRRHADVWVSSPKVSELADRYEKF